MRNPRARPRPPRLNLIIRQGSQDFFTQEMTAHLNEIKSYDPAPDKVFSAGHDGRIHLGQFYELSRGVCGFDLKEASWAITI